MINQSLVSAPAARPLRRLAAFLIDYMVIVGYAGLLAVVTFGVTAGANSMGIHIAWPANPLLADLLAFVTLILPVILYFALLESSPREATLGKRKVGLRVVDARGDRLTRGRSFLRTVLKLLPWQIAHTCLFHIEGWPASPAQPTPALMAGFVLVYVLVAIYLGTMLLRKDHRTLYDWAAGAYVVAGD